MLEKKPEGIKCYIVRIFADGEQCPDLDDSETMKPRCRKYEELLTWDRAGHVLKCKECLDEEPQGVPV